MIITTRQNRMPNDDNLYSIFEIKAVGLIKNTRGESFPEFCKSYNYDPNDIPPKEIADLILIWVCGVPKEGV